MKNYLFILILILSCSCSMEKMMTRRMSKMNEVDKKNMISKMMSCFDSTSCSDMMDIFFSDSSKEFEIKTMALQMMPKCYYNILLNLDETDQIEFSSSYSHEIILNLS